ncbi:MAG: hypothetical protein ACO1N5_13430 [Noviherbaspirillum sp.]
MPDIRPDYFSFSYGIDRIMPDARERPELPESAPLRPAEVEARPELERLLALPDIEDFIIGELAPQLTDAAILSPARFREALADALAGLRAAAEARPRAARALGSAAGLLADEVRMRELLHMYQSALLKV